METGYCILITDRNPHVREYLKREMTAAGYRIRLAKNGREVLKWIFYPEPLDLLILDPDLPDVDKLSVYQRVQDRIPSLPVVIHTFSADAGDFESLYKEAVFVEKCGNSAERLKTAVSNILGRTRW